MEDVEAGFYNCSLSPHVRPLAIYGVNDQSYFPYCSAPIQISSDANKTPENIDKDRQFELSALWPLMMLNCRTRGYGYEEAKANGAQDKVDPVDIQYFKKNGNNVTVFIHGYNVDVGELGKEVESIQSRAAYADKLRHSMLPNGDLIHAQDEKLARNTV